jgi:hypothetical protein
MDYDGKKHLWEERKKEAYIMLYDDLKQSPSEVPKLEDELFDLLIPDSLTLTAI